MTTYSPATAAAVREHFLGTGSAPGSYTDGDIIELPGGSLAMAGDLITPAGRFDGVTLKPAGSTPPVISGAKVLIVNDSSTPTYIYGLHFNLSGVGKTTNDYGSMDLQDGKFWLEDCRIYASNNNTQNLLTAVASATACWVQLWRCVIDGANYDCLSTKAPGGATKAAHSLLQAIRCSIRRPGSLSNNQCATGHDGFELQTISCQIYDTDAEKVTLAQDFATTRQLSINDGVARGLIGSNILGRWLTPGPVWTERQLWT